MSKIKFVIWFPGSGYPFPEPKISETFIKPLSRGEILDLYSDSDYIINITEYEEDEDDGFYVPDFEFEGAYSEIYSATFIIEDLDEDLEDLLNGFSTGFDASIDELVEYIEGNGGKVGYIKFQGLDDPDRDIKPIAEPIPDSLIDCISDPKIISADVALDICINGFDFSAMNKESQDKFKKALASRGDIDQDLIAALDSVARVKKRNTF